jgi:hypothetical protein
MLFLVPDLYFPFPLQPMLQELGWKRERESGGMGAKVTEVRGLPMKR